MKKTKERKLRAAGWRVGSIKDFLDLTPEEVVLIELKLALAVMVQSEFRRSG